MSDDVVTVLDEDRCWELLEANEFGRLAFSVANEPDIVPVNFCARNRKLYIRTGAGSKLLSVTINRKIAFEFDKVRPTEAMSVIIHGQARELYTDEERDFFDTLPLRPWVSTEKYHYLEITPDQVSGRRFLLRSVTDD